MILKKKNLKFHRGVLEPFSCVPSKFESLTTILVKDITFFQTLLQRRYNAYYLPTRHVSTTLLGRRFNVLTL